MKRRHLLTILLAVLVVPATYTSLNLDRYESSPGTDITVTWVFSERNPEILAFYDEVIQRFETENPGVQVNYRYLARMSQRLPTLVASPTKPDIIFTQGAGLLQELYDVGAIRDLSTPMIDGGWAADFLPAALENFTYDDKIIGVPHHITKIDFYYNKALFDAVGVDADDISTWTDFMAAIDALRASGVTPIAAGPADPWTVGMYFGLFATRTCGEAAFTVAMRNEGLGFMQPCWIEAAEMVRQLAEADAFQRGFGASKYPKASGLFGDGEAAMILAYSATTPSEQRKNATDGVGLPFDRIGVMSIPVVTGAEGSRTDVYGAVGGWALMEGSSDEALEFLKFLTNGPNQQRLADLNLNIPVHVAAGNSISDPLLRQAAGDVRRSDWFQTFIENAMPAAVGQTMFDITVDLLNLRITAEEAMQKLQSVAELG